VKISAYGNHDAILVILFISVMPFLVIQIDVEAEAQMV
jgi:hypothetical protein